MSPDPGLSHQDHRSQTPNVSPFTATPEKPFRSVHQDQSLNPDLYQNAILGPVVHAWPVVPPSPADKKTSYLAEVTRRKKLGPAQIRRGAEQNQRDSGIWLACLQGDRLPLELLQATARRPQGRRRIYWRDCDVIWERLKFPQKSSSVLLSSDGISCCFTRSEQKEGDERADSLAFSSLILISLLKSIPHGICGQEPGRQILQPREGFRAK